MMHPHAVKMVNDTETKHAGTATVTDGPAADA